MVRRRAGKGAPHTPRAYTRAHKGGVAMVMATGTWLNLHHVVQGKAAAVAATADEPAGVYWCYHC